MTLGGLSIPMHFPTEDHGGRFDIWATWLLYYICIFVWLHSSARILKATTLLITWSGDVIGRLFFYVRQWMGDLSTLEILCSQGCGAGRCHREQTHLGGHPFLTFHHAMYVNKCSKIWLRLTLFISQHSIHPVIDPECKHCSNIPSRITTLPSDLRCRCSRAGSCTSPHPHSIKTSFSSPLANDQLRMAVVNSVTADTPPVQLIPNVLQEVTVDPNMIASPQHYKKPVDEKPIIIIIPGDKPERIFRLPPCPHVASTACHTALWWSKRSIGQIGWEQASWNGRAWRTQHLNLKERIQFVFGYYTVVMSICTHDLYQFHWLSWLSRHFVIKCLIQSYVLWAVMPRKPRKPWKP